MYTHPTLISMTHPGLFLTALTSHSFLIMRAIRKSALLGIICLLPFMGGQAQDASTYTVKSGDTLYRIALNHNLTVDELRTLNNLESDTIQPGQILRVASLEAPQPVSVPATTEPDIEVPAPQEKWPEEEVAEEWPSREAAFSRVVPREKRPYLVKQGDTYYSIGLDLDVPAYAIYALNEGRTDALQPSEEIWIPDISKRPRPGAQNGPRGYVVKRGDTLFSIARREGSSVEAIRAANGLAGTNLRVGEVLVIPDEAGEAPSPTDREVPPLFETGPVDIYPDSFAGQLTESGRPYDPLRYTVSHPDLPLETLVLLTNPETGFSTFAEVSDRGPQDAQYVMDVSAAVGRELGLIRGVLQQIQIRVVE